MTTFFEQCTMKFMLDTNAYNELLDNNITVEELKGALFIIPLLSWCGNEAEKNIRNVKKVNMQLQKELFELYPEYKNKYH